MQLRRCIKKNKPLWAVVFKWCPTASTGTSRLTLCRHALLLSASDSRQHSPRLTTRSGYFSVKPKAVDVFWNTEPGVMITPRSSTDLARSWENKSFLNSILPVYWNLGINLDFFFLIQLTPSSEVDTSSVYYYLSIYLSTSRFTAQQSTYTVYPQEKRWILNEV